MGSFYSYPKNLQSLSGAPKTHYLELSYLKIRLHHLLKIFAGDRRRLPFEEDPPLFLSLLLDGLLEHGNENRPADADENAPDPGANGGNRWWGIVKEIQMIVFGFITSLLPGFHDME